MVLRVVGAAIFRGNTVLAARRGPGRALAGFWEFPGGKVEPGESDAAALAREIAEELGLVVDVGPALGESRHAWSGGEICLVVHACRADGEPAPTDHDAVRWLGPEDLESVNWAPADLPLLPAVRARF